MNSTLTRHVAGSFLAAFFAFALGFGFAGAPRVAAQPATGSKAAASPRSHLAVELGHPVYGIIEAAELRGVLSRLSSVKPYT
ncbi:MAG: hypothetical protein WBH66_02505, partial [Rectinemataceae bacterium]